jgi:hypothetical protein
MQQASVGELHFLLQKIFREQYFNQRVYINQIFYTNQEQPLIGNKEKDPLTIKLDMRRGSRATSDKTLSTLIPNVMCLYCNGVGTKSSQENPINIIIIKNKSMVIIQLKSPTYFRNILQQTKLKNLRITNFI